MPVSHDLHRLTKTCWALSVLAVLFLAGAIAGGWWSNNWALWVDSRFAYFGGDLLYSHGPVGIRGLGTIENQEFTSPFWQWSLSWCGFYTGSFDCSCSLIVPAVFAGTGAALLWYRRWRPFHRHRPPDPGRRLLRTRWMLTVLLGGLVFAIVPTMFMKAEYRGGSIFLEVHNGRFEGAWFHTSVWESRGWRFESIASPWVSKPHWWNPTSMRLFDIWVESDGLYTAGASLWFLACLLSLPVALLWFIHLRHYPRGQCPHCRYDLTGLAANAPCPECGRSVRIAPPA